MAALNHSGIIQRKLAEKDSIFFKFQGNDTVLSDSARVVQEIAAKHGGSNVQFAESDKESDEIWAARKAILFAALGHSGYDSRSRVGPL
jgi:D-lactate dehydrogenase (cytochrome)